MGCGCMKGRSRRGFGALSGHPSKSKLAEALRELGYEKAAKGAANCEAFGKDVFCFPCFASIEQRREAETKLAERGFKINRRYGTWQGHPDTGPGACAEVRVSYFKAWHYDE